MTARVLGLAVAGAALLGVLVTPASAQPSCKNDRIIAKSEIRAFRNAESEAKKQWEKAAQERFGEKFGKWDNAKDADVECEDAKSPTLGLSAKVCTAFGRPCSRDDDQEVVREREAEKKTDRRSDVRRRDGDRDARRRDDDWYTRRRDRNRFGSRDDWWVRHRQRLYNAAMRHQDHLTRRRHRAEKRAYRREMAYWRNLYRRRADAGWD